jgi:simple sugar transport system ATP-binding protein
VTGSCDPRQESSASLARMMIGSELPHPRHREAHAGEARLVIDQLTLPADDPFGTPLHEVSLVVHAGEIVGVAGVSGNGQQELMRALSGERTIERDAAIRIDGRSAGGLDAAQRRELGLAFVPEDRLGRGAVPDLTLADNVLLTAHRKGMVRRGFVVDAVVRAFADRTIAEFGVKAQGPQAAARSLSGGNLQKFIVGREMRQQPSVLIAAQPTWGVDVGAAAQIRQALIDLRDRGVAVLIVSEELDELFEICDRIAVIAQGRLSPAQQVATTDAAEIGLLMSGAFIAEGPHDTRRFSPAGALGL